MDNKLKSTIGIVVILLIGIGLTQWFFSRQRASFGPSDVSPEATPFPAPHFENTDLGIGFDYSTELSEPVESTVSGQAAGTRWSAGFDNIPGLQVSASTADFAATEWMGNPWWINAKISNDESEEAVLQKVKKEMPLALKIEKVTNSQNVSGFKVYVLNCVIACQLERFFVIPLDHPMYNNLIISSVLKGMGKPANAPQLPIASGSALVLTEIPADFTKKLQDSAPGDITKIESGEAEPDTLNNARWQQEIFDSLVFTSSR